jgi:uncharacterized membrane protein
MTDLIVIGFDHKWDADEALRRVQDAADQGLLDIQDSAVIIRDETGKASYRTTVPLADAGTGAGVGAVWGMVIGALFAPLTGGASVAAGAVATAAAGGALGGAMGGALYGGLSKDDFDSSFTAAVEAQMRPGTSALVLMLSGVHSTTERILEELLPLQGRVIKTNLSPATEAKLSSAIASPA